MKLISYRGRMLTIPELAAETGVREPVLRMRLRRGATVEEAVAQGAGPRRPRYMFGDDGALVTIPEYARAHGIAYRAALERFSSQICAAMDRAVCDMGRDNVTALDVVLYYAAMVLDKAGAHD